MSQDDGFLTIIIYAPYAKVAESEFHIEDETVIFFSNPYYLRLHLPKRVRDDDDGNVARYDVDKGTFTAKIAKENRGEVFEGLDMLTTLLTPPEPCEKPTTSASLVEEVSSPLVEPAPSSQQAERPENTLDVEGAVGGAEEGEKFDWYIDQYPLVAENEGAMLPERAKYGFAQQKFGLSQQLLIEFCEILDVKYPDDVSSSEKRQQRLVSEQERFFGEHYLADLYDSDEIPEILSFQPWWSKSLGQLTLSEEAKELMLKLPRKKYLIDVDVLPSVYLGLVDIVFAYAYNHRVLYGENNVESGWTIAKVASTLSWLDSFTSLQDVMVSCFRRALTFPLHRNWDLCIKVLEDVQTLFAGGKKPLLKCLLDIHACMIVTDPHYVFNDLYITDYCVWIQSAKSEKIQSLASALKDLSVSKGDIGFELEEMESAAMLVLKERESGAGVDVLTDKIRRMGVRTSTTALDSDDDIDTIDSDDDDNVADDNVEDDNVEDDNVEDDNVEDDNVHFVILNEDGSASDEEYSAGGDSEAESGDKQLQFDHDTDSETDSVEIHHVIGNENDFEPVDR